MPKLAPVTLQHLSALCHNLDLNNTLDTMVYTMAAMFFWFQCRLAEMCIEMLLTPLPIPAGQHHKNQASLSPKLFSIPSRPDSGCPWSAQWAFNNHLKINSHIPSSSHMFAFEGTGSLVYPMHKSLFLSCCYEIWSKCGLYSMGNHSFQISGTTHMLLISIDPFIVMVQGQWKSNAFLE